MIRINPVLAYEPLKKRGISAYNALMTIKNHPDAIVWADDDLNPTTFLIVDGYWVIPIGMSLEMVVEIMKNEGYASFGVSGAEFGYYEYAQSNGFTIEWANPCHLFVYDGDKPSDTTPEGFYADVLTPLDAPIIDDYYTYKSDTSLDEILEAIETRSTVGIRTSDHELASWVLIHVDGTMGIMYTKEKYRKLGLGRVASNLLIQKQLSNGEIPYVHVVFGNDASIKLTEKLGMKNVVNVAWFGIIIE